MKPGREPVAAKPERGRRAAEPERGRGAAEPRPLEPAAPAFHDVPVPNPPPVPGDLPAPRLATPREALRRSLVLWGWGQVVAGDRRGWLGPPAQAASIVGLAVGGPALAAGTNGELAFLAGAAVLLAWALIAVHAHRRAARRRAALDLPPGDTGAAELLWLAPLAIALSSAFWIGAGDAGNPAVALDRYVADWRAGRAADAAARFATPPDAGVLAETWDRQLAALRNELLARAAAAGPDSGIDPDRPLESVRWVDAGPTPSGGRLFALEVARRETVRGQLFAILPTTSQRLVTIARLGHVELRLVDGPGAEGGRMWRIVRTEIGGVEQSGVGAEEAGPLTSPSALP